VTCRTSGVIATFLRSWEVHGRTPRAILAARPRGRIAPPCVGIVSFLHVLVSRHGARAGAGQPIGPLGATVGDFLDKPRAAGGLDMSRYWGSAALAILVVLCVALLPQAGRAKDRFQRAVIGSRSGRPLARSGWTGSEALPEAAAWTGQGTVLPRRVTGHRTSAASRTASGCLYSNRTPCPPSRAASVTWAPRRRAMAVTMARPRPLPVCPVPGTR
jgi:hypothetical protein